MADSLIPIRVEADIVIARNETRRVARKVGFSMSEQIKVTIAVSELARNIIKYAGKGEIKVSEMGSPRGVEIIAEDNGPGIANIEEVQRKGFTTSRSLGMGMTAVQAAVDSFHIESTVGVGTKVTCRKYV
ncbi:MAG: anti-sigma regulatory factor [Gemmatimonadetes bacterium]|nr:MAG: anti-sigma regulatory factor [Gemmatimonadota bacterium]